MVHILCQANLLLLLIVLLVALLFFFTEEINEVAGNQCDYRNWNKDQH